MGERERERKREKKKKIEKDLSVCLTLSWFFPSESIF